MTLSSRLPSRNFVGQLGPRLPGFGFARRPNLPVSNRYSTRITPQTRRLSGMRWHSCFKEKGPTVVHKLWKKHTFCVTFFPYRACAGIRASKKKVRPHFSRPVIELRMAQISNKKGLVKDLANFSRYIRESVVFWETCLVSIVKLHWRCRFITWTYKPTVMLRWNAPSSLDKNKQ